MLGGLPYGPVLSNIRAFWLSCLARLCGKYCERAAFCLGVCKNAEEKTNFRSRSRKRAVDFCSSAGIRPILNTASSPLNGSMTSIATEPSNQELQELPFTINHNSHVLKDKKLHFNKKTGRVVLQGSVKSYFEKQLAQEALRNVECVREIKNELVVDWA